MFARRFIPLSLVVAVAVWSLVARSAELSPEQKAKLTELDASLQKVVTLYKEKKTDEVKKLVGEIDASLSAYLVANEGDASLAAVLAPYRARLDAARKLSLHAPAVAVAKPVAKPMPNAMPAGTTPAPTTTAAAGAVTQPPPRIAGQVSFVRDVLPMLKGKCGNCHVTGTRGDFNMGTFNALMAGTGGTLSVIKPGNGKTSTLAVKISDGEMPPPGGAQVTDAELATLIKWIDEGAKYDSTDPSTPFMSFNADGSFGAAATQQPLARAGAGDKILFMRDVAPLLVTSCFDCHGNIGGNNNAGNFSMATFQALMRGGQDGPVVTAGNPDGSVLVQMLKGTAKDQQMMPRRRMPQNGTPFDESRMSIITKWIADGAKFDGEDPNMSIELAYRIALAKAATHEELTAQRMTAALKNWKTANPDSPSETIEMTDFLLVGDLGPVRMQEVQKVVETEKAKIVQKLKIPGDKPLLKGRLTINFFDKSFEHKEYSRVLEQRELSPGINAHWGFNYIDAYACVTARGTAEEMAPLISEVIVGAYLDSCGSDAPKWFTLGAARNIVAQIHAKSETVKQWEDAINSIGVVSADAILKTKNADPGIAAICQDFVKGLARSPNWGNFQAAVLRGTKFDGAFRQAYNSDPLPMMQKWTNRQ